MDSPAFGRADLSNCERELIHLAGSVQPHGALLLLREDNLAVLQASANCVAVLGLPTQALLEHTLKLLGGDIEARVTELLPGLGADPLPLQCTVQPPGATRRLEGALHRAPGGGLVLELEGLDPPPRAPPASAWTPPRCRSTSPARRAASRPRLR